MRAKQRKIHETESSIARAMILFGDYYSLQIIQLLLKNGAQRFAELLRQLDGITCRGLSLRLKHLQSHGLVQRHEQCYKSWVEYKLTDAGRRTEFFLSAMDNWINQCYPYDEKQQTQR